MDLECTPEVIQALLIRWASVGLLRGVLEGCRAAFVRLDDPAAAPVVR